MKAEGLEQGGQLRRTGIPGAVPVVVVATVLVVLPFFMPYHLQSLATKALIFAVFSMSLNILTGYAGLFSLGHAAYFGAGAFAIGALYIHGGIKSLWLGAPFGILTAGAVAAILGIVALRVSGVYFLLITFAFGQLLYSVAWKWSWLKSPGAEGIAGISKPTLGLPWFHWGTTSFYYFVLLVFAVCFFIIYLNLRSPFGLALRGIRECEDRMRCLGYHVWLHKYVAFIIAGLFAGVAGVLFAYHNGLVLPVHVDVTTSTLVMLMVIIGGAGTVFGPLIGAAVIVFVEFFASTFLPERWPLILGAVFVASVMYLRGGIAQHLSALWERREG